MVVEASRAAVGWLFENSALHQLTTVCDAEHVRAHRVLEKLGFEREGVLKNHLVIPAFGRLKRDGVLYVKVNA